MASTPNLEHLPSASVDSHIWADYIELLSLFNVDGIVDKSDLLDRIRDRPGLGEIEPLEKELLDDTGPSAEDDETGADSFVPERSRAELNDKWESQAYAWFAHLKYRRATFSDFYPFIISDTDDGLTRCDPLTEKHKLYIFLLLLSNLRYFKAHESAFTSAFEILSWEVLKCCLPDSADVHVFSRNPHADAHYKGLNLWGKIKKLEGDLRESIEVAKAEFKPKDTADNGLDLVGWVPFGDTNNGLLIVFAQCACTLKWPAKQSESSAHHWRGTFRLKVPPSNMVFIPFCFRKSDGTWFNEHDIHGETILIDRGRLLYMLRTKYGVLKDLPSYLSLEELLPERENIF